MSVSRKEHYEVAILGGGPAGLTTALWLRRMGLVPIVLEGTRKTPHRYAESLPPECNPLLSSLGLWPDFRASGHLPSLGTCFAWGSSEVSFNDHLFHPQTCGWHLNRKRFDEMLTREATSQGVEIVSESRGLSIRHSRNGYQVRGTRAGVAFTVQARFLLDATGRSSVFARRMGRGLERLDSLVAVGGTFPTSELRESIGYTSVEARPEGWWYSAPLPGDKISVTLMTDADGVSQLGLSQPPTWFALCKRTHQIARRLEKIQPGWIPTVHPASVQRNEFCGDDWLTLGDSSFTCDPLSGQGLFKAMRGAEPAARAVAARLGGQANALQEYREQLEIAWQRHVTHRRELYQRERRWPHSPFWSRRHHPKTLPEA